MRYEFACDHCELTIGVDSRPFHPPTTPTCQECFEEMRRVYGCQIDTSGCKDHDFIPPEKRINYGGMKDLTPGQAAAREAAHQRKIQATRQAVREGGNKGDFQKSHEIPAELYHGKIAETKDRAYWADPKNVKKHNSCKVT
jgi:hypothetical protein